MLNLDAAALSLSSLPIPDYESGAMVPFRFKPTQVTILNKMKEQQSNGKPVRMIICKSRRVGGSAVVDGLGVMHCSAEENVQALIVAHRKEAVKNLFRVPTTLVKGFHQTGYDLPLHTQ